MAASDPPEVFPPFGGVSGVFSSVGLSLPYGTGGRNRCRGRMVRLYSAYNAYKAYSEFFKVPRAFILCGFRASFLRGLSCHLSIVKLPLIDSEVATYR